MRLTRLSIVGLCAGFCALVVGWLFTRILPSSGAPKETEEKDAPREQALSERSHNWEPLPTEMLLQRRLQQPQNVNFDMKTCFVIVLTASLIFCCFTASSEAQTNGGGAVLDNISSQFTTSTKKWETTIKGHAVKLFWILAAIAAVWTFIMLVLRQADLAELFGAVTRFTFVTFFFYWILAQRGGIRGKDNAIHAADWQ